MEHDVQRRTRLEYPSVLFSFLFSSPAPGLPTCSGRVTIYMHLQCFMGQAWNS